jgi:hypothetical protein
VHVCMTRLALRRGFFISESYWCVYAGSWASRMTQSGVAQNTVADQILTGQMTRRKDTISVSSEEEGFAAVIHRARNVELKFRYEEEQSSAAEA